MTSPIQPSPFQSHVISLDNFNVMVTMIGFYDNVADEGIAHYLTDCGAGP